MVMDNTPIMHKTLFNEQLVQYFPVFIKYFPT